MTLINKLRESGLSESEARVYVYLLEKGMSTPPQVAKGTGILRANSYHVLAALKEKGLVEGTKGMRGVKGVRVGKRESYIARDPGALVASLERKKEELNELVPDLRALTAAQKNKPSIRFYNGWEEVKEIYKLSLETEECWAMGSINKLNEVDAKFLHWYNREVHRRRIIFRDLVPHQSAEGAKKFQETIGALYSVKLLPAKYKDFDTDMLFWGDSVAFVTLEEPIFGTVITNPALARTFRTILNVLHDTP